ncbi:C40 family peptidase [Streptomyces sp. TLI_171]|uniref:C40 family peptidase n=1 Tax=Streptomyces sp. TLI_171 TaxID=1938859 RepID=UPI000C48739D|nr:C40 family peptidase [Streptomyces sp. TLI_171]RKE23437.1 cell wall-associated NlpC family hydrolase [Streptomyces sp. TLI_171]
MTTRVNPVSRWMFAPLRCAAILSVLASLAVFFAGVGAQPAQAAPACGVLAPGAAPQAAAAVNAACGQIGTPYSWGGGHGSAPGPSYGSCDASNGAPNDCHVRGLDCSGLVRYAYYLAVGADVINGTTYTQWPSSRAVARYYRSDGTAPLLPGDLVFYGNTASTIHHVALYLGNGYIVEAPYSGGYVQVATLSSHGDYYGAIRLYGPGGGSTTPPPSSGGQYWVDTFANAPAFGSPTGTAQTGTLYQGTNYVFCKAWGREIASGSSYNHWWLKTDPDVGPGGQWVSAFYLSRWGNDVAKDNNGTVIPDCPGGGAPPSTGKYWVDTFANASVYSSPTGTAQTGTLYQGTNYVFCKAWGREIASGSSYNHWWLKTDPDVGPGGQWVSAFYLSRWGNDVAKDNNGTVIPDC